jgi:hypothetical protein
MAPFKGLRKFLSSGSKRVGILITVVIIALIAGVDPREALELFGVLPTSS